MLIVCDRAVESPKEIVQRQVCFERIRTVGVVVGEKKKESRCPNTPHSHTKDKTKQ
jgi:hypothetical protein